METVYREHPLDMSTPPVDIQPGDTIFKADEKVERAFEARGESLAELRDGVNTTETHSSYCHLYRVDRGDHAAVVVVMVARWEEPVVVQVVNYLLEVRMYPTPPGSRPTFHFYSAYEVPPILLTLFGASPACDFECRSLLVAKFGNDLSARQCQQLGAVGAHLTHECFDVTIGLDDPGGAKIVQDTIERRFRRNEECLDPVNSLITLGCLYGEVLRHRLPFRSRWADIEEFSPWPGLVFEGRTVLDGRTGEPGNGRRAAEEVTFSPIETAIHFFRTLQPDWLLESSQELEAACRESFGDVDAPP